MTSLETLDSAIDEATNLTAMTMWTNYEHLARLRGIRKELDKVPAAASEQVKSARWKRLDAALQALKLAEFELRRTVGATVSDIDHIDAAGTQLDDVRTALGELALLLADGPDAEGYARLLGEVLRPRPARSTL